MHPFKQPIQHPLLASISSELNRYNIGLVTASIDQKFIEPDWSGHGQVSHTLHLKLVILTGKPKPEIKGHRYPFAEWVDSFPTGHTLPMEEFDLAPGQGKWHVQETQVEVEYSQRWFLNVMLVRYEKIKPPLMPTGMSIKLNKRSQELLSPKQFAQEVQGEPYIPSEWMPLGINRGVDPIKLADMKGTPLTLEVITEAVNRIASEEGYDPRMGRGYTRFPNETDEELRHRIKKEEQRLAEVAYTRTRDGEGEVMILDSLSGVIDEYEKKPEIKRTDTYWGMTSAKPTTTKPK